MRRLIMLAVFAAITLHGIAAQTANFNWVVPRPETINYFDASAPFTLSAETKLMISDDNADLRRIAGFLRGYIKDMTKIDVAPDVKVGNVKADGKKADGSTIVLTLSKKVKNVSGEGYLLRVFPHTIQIVGATPAGVFYGVQTLRKSLPVLTAAETVEVPAGSVIDSPRFGYRGMMLDCSRHFFSADFVKKYIDMLALHNMNRFHWHLTDDQGWRLAVDKYPNLTKVGAWRESTVLGHNSDVMDGMRYGGYYTDAEIRDIVKYAADRFITIIPEIDMPGHMLAALASYPELGCTGGPYATGQYWGIYPDILCAGQEKTYDFVKAVLDKVCDLFPGEYIHIGGDESPRARWEKCPRCQAVIAREHLQAKDGQKPEALLQGYFTRRVEAYLESKGRKIIGWDELLGCGVDTTATIMSWRGTEPGAKAAKLHHDVIMTPTSYLYFDYYQSRNTQSEPQAIGGFVDVERVYSLEPVAPELSAAEAKHITGVQANVWTEYISVPNQVEYMALPRMAALSEVQWTKGKRDYDFFKTRLGSFRRIYDLYGYTYAKHLWPADFMEGFRKVFQ